MSDTETNDKKKSWFARHKVLTVILALIVLIIIVSTTGGGKKKTGNGDANSTSQKSEQKQQRFAGRADSQPKDVELLPGEKATLDGVEMTVTKAEYAASLGDYDKAKDGKIYLTVTVSLKNTANKAKPYNPFDFRVQTAGGQVLDSTIVLSGNSKLESGDLVQGGTVSGTITFEVPVEQSAEYVIWKPNAFNADRAIIQVKQ